MSTSAQMFVRLVCKTLVDVFLWVQTKLLIESMKSMSQNHCHQALLLSAFSFFYQTTTSAPRTTTQCTYYHFAPFIILLELLHLGGLTGDVTCLSPSPLSVLLLPLRWNLMAKSGDCWEMNFRKRFHSFLNTVTPLPLTFHSAPLPHCHCLYSVGLWLHLLFFSPGL